MSRIKFEEERGQYVRVICQHFPGKHHRSLRRRLRDIVDLDDSWDCAGRIVWSERHKLQLSPENLANLKLLSEWIRAQEKQEATA